MTTAISLPSPGIHSYRTRNDELQGAFTGCFLNGIFIAAVCSTLYACVSKKGWNSLLRPMICSMLVMYALATMTLIGLWERIRVAFIKNGQTEDTTFANLVKGGSPLLIGLVDISFAVNIVIANSVLIWRCWILWGRNWGIVMLPILFVMAELASGLVIIALELSDVPATSLGSTYNIMALTNTAASLVGTLLTSALIIYRILCTGSTKFRAAMEMIIESAALYSIVLIFYISFSVLPPIFSGVIPAAILSQVTGLAPTLMVAQVTFGLTRPASGWTNIQVLNLHSRSRALSHTTDQSDHTNELFDQDHIRRQGPIDERSIGLEEV